MLYVCQIYYKFNIDVLIVRAESKAEAKEKIASAMQEAEYSCETIVTHRLKFDEEVYRHPDIAYVYGEAIEKVRK